MAPDTLSTGMIHLPPGVRSRFGRPGPSPAAPPPQRTLSRQEAQEVVDAATAILDGIKVLLVLADQGNAPALDALRQWRDVLGRLARL